MYLKTVVVKGTFKGFFYLHTFNEISFSTFELNVWDTRGLDVL